VGTPPVPDNVTACGLPTALSVIVSDALRAPVAVGLNVTLMVHEDPTVRVLPQVWVWAKSPLLVPVIAMLDIVSVLPPLFLTVTVWAALVVPVFWLPKTSDVGDNVAADTAVPARVAVCGLPVALSVTETDALRAPMAVGLNVTLMEHLPPTATLVPQVLVSVKSPLLVPVIAMLLTVIVAVPVFDKVMV